MFVLLRLLPWARDGVHVNAGTSEVDVDHYPPHGGKSRRLPVFICVDTHLNRICGHEAFDLLRLPGSACPT